MGLSGDSVVAQGLDCRRADDVHLRAIFHPGAEELVVGPVEGDLDGQVVDDVDGLDVAYHADEVHVGVGSLAELRRILVEEAVEVELDGIGIEGRAVVEPHALTQVERVLGSVVRDLP